MTRKIGSSYYYYLYNGHGDVVQVIDENGNIVNSYAYNEWGNHEEWKNPALGIDNPIRYVGEYYDEESGLYYLRARYFDPTTGRFISRDSYDGNRKSLEPHMLKTGVGGLGIEVSQGKTIRFSRLFGRN